MSTDSRVDLLLQGNRYKYAWEHGLDRHRAPPYYNREIVDDLGSYRVPDPAGRSPARPPFPFLNRGETGLDRERMTRPRALRFLLAVAVTVIVGTSACSSSGSSDASVPGSRARRTPLVATDVAKQAGLARATHTHGENCVADFDGDGKLDVLLSTHDTTSAPPAWPLMRGLGDGRFQRDERFQLAPGDRHGCAAADFNADGLLDVYLSIGGCKGTCKAPKELWIQQPNHTFKNEAEQWGISDPGGRGRVPVVLNANGDKLPDLYTAQEKGVDHPSLSRLWINRGDHFELQRGPQTNDIGDLCAAAADIDGNGLDEIAMCTPANGFLLFRNERGRFVSDASSFGVADYGRRDVKFVDLNNDGRPDLATVARTRVQVYLNKGGRYGDPSFDLATTDGIDVAFGDVDGDGDLDIYVQQGIASSEPDQVFLNEGGGPRFTPGPKLSRARNGAGDTVTAIRDWKGTGRAAFLVNNGFQDAIAPRQLFEFSGG